MEENKLLLKLKRRLGIKQEDTLEDSLLNDIIEDSISHFKLITGANEVDDKYNFIILDVADIRYTRKGSAGLSSESVDGYSTNFKSIEDDFKPYMKFLEKDFNLKDEFRQKGRVRFY